MKKWIKVKGGIIKRGVFMSKMDKPSDLYNNSSTSTPSQLPNFIPDPSIRGLSFDQLLNNRGIRFTHRRGTPCPNMKARDDNAHDPECTICDKRGWLYYEEKSVVGVFQGNSLERLFEQQGMWETGTAIITFPAEYDDGSQADFNEFDQVVGEFEVRLWELIEYKRTSNKQQQLRFPITNIDYIASITNNVLTTYIVGVNYNIVNGNIEWIVGHEPTWNAAADRGVVLSVSYYAHPIYTVLQTMRELRVTQEMVNGQKIARRLPQEVLVKRDFLTRTADKIE